MTPQALCRGNKYACSNRVISVAIQLRCKYAFPTIEMLCFLRGPCKHVIKKSSVEKKLVEFRDASLPGYELGSRGIELSLQLQNNDKKGIRL
jgi:hypothetical protein